jgi:hypothetical protein
METGLASLLDNPQFLEELGKIEALPREDTSVFPKPVPTLADGAQPSATAEAPVTIGPRVQGPQFMHPATTRNLKSGSRLGQARGSAKPRRSASDSEPTSAPASGRVRDSANDGRPAHANTPAEESSLSSFPAEAAHDPLVKAAGKAAGKAAVHTNVKAGRPSAMRPVLAVVGFVLMMSIGAGAAALVFHDRVAQIVAQWQSASH